LADWVGTGYSSLSYLRSFPFDKIKIDQSFVCDIVAIAESAAILRAVIGLGTEFGLSIVAEASKPRSKWPCCAPQGAARSTASTSANPPDRRDCGVSQPAGGASLYRRLNGRRPNP
jgi:predicted signal transduction protein with EAL and GGDEF domain